MAEHGHIFGLIMKRYPHFPTEQVGPIATRICYALGSTTASEAEIDAAILQECGPIVSATPEPTADAPAVGTSEPPPAA